MAKKTAKMSSKVVLPVIELALNRIRVDETRNLRRFPPNAKELQELTDSIEARGLIHPITVRPLVEATPEGFDYELVAGYQRYKAIQALISKGLVLEKIPVTVKDSTDMESRATNLDENNSRSSTSYIDAAYAIKELQEKDGLNKVEIAKRMRKTGAWVGYVEKLLSLRPEVQKKIHEGKISWRASRDLPDLTEEEQDTAIALAEKGDKAGAAASTKKSKAGKERKSKRGRKAREDVSDGRGLSAKQVIAQFDEQVKAISDQEKFNKAEGKAMELYSDISRFIGGAFGMKALHNRVLKMV
jgi:ParB/RepB/Spo0J family partition protein